MSKEDKTGILQEVPLSETEKNERILKLLQELKNILQNIPELPQQLRQSCFGEAEVLSGQFQDISLTTSFQRGGYDWELKYERHKFFADSSADSRLLQQGEMLEINQETDGTVLRGIEIRTGKSLSGGFFDPIKENEFTTVKTSQIGKNMNGYTTEQDSIRALEESEKFKAILEKST